MLDVAMIPLTDPGDNLPVLVVEEETGLPLANADLVFQNLEFLLTVRTDGRGWARVPIAFRDSFTIYPAVWGRLPRPGVVLEPGRAAVIRLSPGYYDDFYFDLGWQTEGQAEQGQWERQVPQELVDWKNDLGETLYFTGPAILNGTEEFGIKDGMVRLVSPQVDLSRFTAPRLQFRFWIYTSITDLSSLQAHLWLEGDSGERIEVWHAVAHVTPFQWIPSGQIKLPAIPDLGRTWRLAFELNNPYQFTPLAMALDILQLSDSLLGSTLVPNDLTVWAYPNPTSGLLRVRCQIPPGHGPVPWTLFDAAGRRLAAGRLQTEATELSFPEAEAAGTYFLTFQPGNRPLKTMRLVKL
jgi:hypothetical protein